MTQKDLFGQALYDYWHNTNPENMVTWTNLTESEVLPTAYLFRDFDKMPVLEQIALQKAKGRILDVGAGSGVHSLWLQNNGNNITALELSPITCQLMQERGINNVINSDFFKFKPTDKFDTLLFLMNGVGIVQKAKYLDRLFKKIDRLMRQNGQALIHSSDLKYLYEMETGYQMPQNDYYGDVDFFVSYKNQVERFNWTYIDENTLRVFAKQQGFTTEKIHESDEGDFLLIVTRQS